MTTCYVLLSRTEIFNVIAQCAFLHVKMRWQMYYNLRLVNKIPFFIHLNRCKSNFVLNKSKPLVLINSTQIQITLPLCTSNGTHAIGCLFEHHHFPGDRQFLVLNLQNQVFSYPGKPKILHSDNGCEFVNAIVASSVV